MRTEIISKMSSVTQKSQQVSKKSSSPSVVPKTASNKSASPTTDGRKRSPTVDSPEGKAKHGSVVRGSTTNSTSSGRKMVPKSITRDSAEVLTNSLKLGRKDESSPPVIEALKAEEQFSAERYEERFSDDMRKIRNAILANSSSEKLLSELAGALENGNKEVGDIFGHTITREEFMYYIPKIVTDQSLLTIGQLDPCWQAITDTQEEVTCGHVRSLLRALGLLEKQVPRREIEKDLENKFKSKIVALEEVRQRETAKLQSDITKVQQRMEGLQDSVKRVVSDMNIIRDRLEKTGNDENPGLVMKLLAQVTEEIGTIDRIVSKDAKGKPIRGSPDDEVDHACIDMDRHRLHSSVVDELKSVIRESSNAHRERRSQVGRYTDAIASNMNDDFAYGGPRDRESDFDFSKVPTAVETEPTTFEIVHRYTDQFGSNTGDDFEDNFAVREDSLDTDEENKRKKEERKSFANMLVEGTVPQDQGGSPKKYPDFAPNPTLSNKTTKSKYPDFAPNPTLRRPKQPVSPKTSNQAKPKHQSIPEIDPISGTPKATRVSGLIGKFHADEAEHEARQSHYENSVLEEVKRKSEDLQKQIEAKNEVKEQARGSVLVELQERVQIRDSMRKHNTVVSALKGLFDMFRMNDAYDEDQIDEMQNRNHALANELGKKDVGGRESAAMASFDGEQDRMSVGCVNYYSRPSYKPGGGLFDIQNLGLRKVGLHQIINGDDHVRRPQTNTAMQDVYNLVKSLDCCVGVKEALLVKIGGNEADLERLLNELQAAMLAKETTEVKHTQKDADGNVRIVRSTDADRRNLDANGDVINNSKPQPSPYGISGTAGITKVNKDGKVITRIDTTQGDLKKDPKQMIYDVNNGNRARAENYSAGERRSERSYFLSDEEEKNLNRACDSSQSPLRNYSGPITNISGAGSRTNIVTNLGSSAHPSSAFLNIAPLPPNVFAQRQYVQTGGKTPLTPSDATQDRLRAEYHRQMYENSKPRVFYTIANHKKLPTTLTKEEFLAQLSPTTAGRTSLVRGPTGIASPIGNATHFHKERTSRTLEKMRTDALSKAATKVVVPKMGDSNRASARGDSYEPEGNRSGNLGLKGFTSELRGVSADSPPKPKPGLSQERTPALTGVVTPKPIEVRGLAAVGIGGSQLMREFRDFKNDLSASNRSGGASPSMDGTVGTRKPHSKRFSGIIEPADVTTVRKSLATATPRIKTRRVSGISDLTVTGNIPSNIPIARDPSPKSQMEAEQRQRTQEMAQKRQLQQQQAYEAMMNRTPILGAPQQPGNVLKLHPPAHPTEGRYTPNNMTPPDGNTPRDSDNGDQKGKTIPLGQILQQQQGKNDQAIPVGLTGTTIPSGKNQKLIVDNTVGGNQPHGTFLTALGVNLPIQSKDWGKGQGGQQTITAESTPGATPNVPPLSARVPPLNFQPTAVYDQLKDLNVSLQNTPQTTVATTAQTPQEQHAGVRSVPNPPRMVTTNQMNTPLPPPNPMSLQPMHVPGIEPIPTHAGFRVKTDLQDDQGNPSMLGSASGKVQTPRILTATLTASTVRGTDTKMGSSMAGVVHELPEVRRTSTLPSTSQNAAVTKDPVTGLATAGSKIANMPGVAAGAKVIAGHIVDHRPSIKQFAMSPKSHSASPRMIMSPATHMEAPNYEKLMDAQKDLLEELEDKFFGDTAMDRHHGSRNYEHFIETDDPNRVMILSPSGKYVYAKQVIPEQDREIDVVFPNPQLFGGMVASKNVYSFGEENDFDGSVASGRMSPSTLQATNNIVTAATEIKNRAANTSEEGSGVVKINGNTDMAERNGILYVRRRDTDDGTASVSYHRIVQPTGVLTQPVMVSGFLHPPWNKGKIRVNTSGKNSPQTSPATEGRPLAAAGNAAVIAASGASRSPGGPGASPGGRRPSTTVTGGRTSITGVKLNAAVRNANISPDMVGLMVGSPLSRSRSPSSPQNRSRSRNKEIDGCSINDVGGALLDQATDAHYSGWNLTNGPQTFAGAAAALSGAGFIANAEGFGAARGRCAEAIRAIMTSCRMNQSMIPRSMKFDEDAFGRMTPPTGAVEYKWWQEQLNNQAELLAQQQQQQQGSNSKITRAVKATSKLTGNQISLTPSRNFMDAYANMPAAQRLSVAPQQAPNLPGGFRPENDRLRQRNPAFMIGFSNTTSNAGNVTTTIPGITNPGNRTSVSIGLANVTSKFNAANRSSMSMGAYRRVSSQNVHLNQQIQQLNEMQMQNRAQMQFNQQRIRTMAEMSMQNKAPLGSPLDSPGNQSASHPNQYVMAKTSDWQFDADAPVMVGGSYAGSNREGAHSESRTPINPRDTVTDPANVNISGAFGTVRRIYEAIAKDSAATVDPYAPRNVANSNANATIKPGQQQHPAGTTTTAEQSGTNRVVDKLHQQPRDMRDLGSIDDLQHLPEEIFVCPASTANKNHVKTPSSSSTGGGGSTTATAGTATGIHQENVRAIGSTRKSGTKSHTGAKTPPRAKSPSGVSVKSPSAGHKTTSSRGVSERAVHKSPTGASSGSRTLGHKTTSSSGSATGVHKTTSSGGGGSAKSPRKSDGVMRKPSIPTSSRSSPKAAKSSTILPKKK